MNRPSRIAKRLIAPAVLVAALAVAQVVSRRSAPAQLHRLRRSRPAAAGPSRSPTRRPTATSSPTFSRCSGTSATEPPPPGCRGARSSTPTRPPIRLSGRSRSPPPTPTQIWSTRPTARTASTRRRTSRSRTRPPTATFTPSRPTLRLGQTVTIQGAARTRTDRELRLGLTTIDAAFDDARRTAALTLNYATATAAPGLKSIALRTHRRLRRRRARRQPCLSTTSSIPRPKRRSSSRRTPSRPASRCRSPAPRPTRPGGSIASYQWDLNNNGVYNEGGATGEVNAATVTTSFACRLRTRSG